MRLYLPATPQDLHQPDGIFPTAAHAATRELAAALEEEDEEALEFAALLASADASVELIAAGGGGPFRRVVVVAEVPRFRAVPVEDGLPSAVVPPRFVAWGEVVSLHVDEQGAEEVVAAAARGDADGLDRASERDLLWFDVSELEGVRALLSSP